MSKSSASHVRSRFVNIEQKSSGKWSKANALYAHYSGEGYDCDDCAFWLTDHRCQIHRSDFTVNEEDKCGFMIQGKPDTFWGKPFLNLSPKQTGFVRNWGGGGCRDCKHYFDRDCDRVDKSSPGDDPNEIHPDACCAGQEKGKR